MQCPPYRQEIVRFIIQRVLKGTYVFLSTGEQQLMRMPSIDAQALAPHLEAIREQIGGLPEHERRSLMQRVNSDRMRANDMRHAMCAERAERQMSRRVDPRQMRLENVA